MNFQREHNRPDPVFQLAPMVDVVFILLSFFVLGMRFRLLEGDLSVAQAGPAEAARLIAADLPAEVPVRLDRSARGGVAIQVAQARLPENGFAALRDKLAEIDLPDTPVRLSYDGALTVQQLADAMDAVLASPMKKMTIASRGAMDGHDQRP